MKKIKKNELISLRAFFNALNIVGLPTQKSLALLKLHRKVEEVQNENAEMQKSLIEKFEIPILDGGKIDTTHENFKAYVDAYSVMVSEEIDLTPYCILTEEEAMVAVQKIDAPLAVIDAIAKILTAEVAESDNNNNNN